MAADSIKPGDFYVLLDLGHSLFAQKRFAKPWRFFMGDVYRMLGDEDKAFSGISTDVGCQSDE